MTRIGDQGGDQTRVGSDTQSLQAGRLQTTAIAREQHDLEELDPYMETDVWGTEVPELSLPFADDPTEDRENPYIYIEKTKTIQLGRYEINVGQELDAVAIAALLKFAEGYNSIFVFEGQLGDCNLVEHEIKTGGAAPINLAPYVRPKREREAVEIQIRAWLEQGLILNPPGRPALSLYLRRTILRDVV